MLQLHSHCKKKKVVSCSVWVSHCSRLQTAERHSNPRNSKHTPGSVHMCMFQTCGLGRSGYKFIFLEYPFILEEIFIDLWKILNLKRLVMIKGVVVVGLGAGLPAITSCTGSQSAGYQTCWMSYKAGWRWNSASVFWEPSTAGLFLTRPSGAPLDPKGRCWICKLELCILQFWPWSDVIWMATAAS